MLHTDIAFIVRTEVNAVYLISLYILVLSK